ncbi:hypothetical protein XELAEV_180425782mg, partial [Xenopus laevis]
MPSLQRRKTIG